jgi:molybdate transport system substrate-binding protein
MQRLTTLILSLLAIATAHAGEATIAVAANFTGPMELLKPAFEKATGHTLTIAYGTVGKFYAQIRNNAPFDALISSDQTVPANLEKDGLALPETRFTYAIGKLMLWSSKPGLVDNKGEVLKRGDFRHLAIANPKVAVYGAAAVQVMEKMGVRPVIEPKWVLGENITQAYQFVATGNADLGFVALSQIYKDGKYAEGSYWAVPPDLYSQIRQDAVLLTRGKGNVAAEALLAYLKGSFAKQVIQSHGYEF